MREQERKRRIEEYNRELSRRRLHSRRRRKRPNPFWRFLAVLIALMVVFLLGFGIWKAVGAFGKAGGLNRIFSGAKTQSDAAAGAGAEEQSGADGDESGADASGQSQSASAEEPGTLEKAKQLASQYDYDGAIRLIQEDTALSDDAAAKEAVASYESEKAGLVRQDPTTVTHVFFHSLIVDTKNAFDKTRWGKLSDGYNQVMTTIPEFERMLDQFYKDGFVLVGLHDLASMETQADGSVKMTQGNIMLPEGKKAMVMSQDDVCYYEYMKGSGFADRIEIGPDGKLTTHYVDQDGKESLGDYDLVPILDRFVEEHPDFSYKGAKACLAFTGYNGILGYRTDETYDPNSPMYDKTKTPNYNIEADRETARKVAQALRDDGYELASHSWGHRNLGTISMEHFKKDTDRWDKNVNQELLGGSCDIILYPFGADVADWHPYTHDNERFQYLFDKGFRYFCNVDSTQHWVQIGSDWLRQGRRNLDGEAMWNDIANGKNRLSDLFPDVSAIFDKDRPTPVPTN